jgi:hypothetical protein
MTELSNKKGGKQARRQGARARPRPRRTSKQQVAASDCAPKQNVSGPVFPSKSRIFFRISAVRKGFLQHLTASKSENPPPFPHTMIYST